MMAAAQRHGERWFRGWKDAAARGTGGMLSAETLRRINREQGIPGVHRLGGGPRPRIMIDPVAFGRWWQRWFRLLRRVK